MSTDIGKQEILRKGIAASLGRLRGDVIPLPVANVSAHGENVIRERQETGVADDALRADPEMKTELSASSVTIGGTEPAGQPDLLSGLEMPNLMPPLTEEERAARARQRRFRRNAIAGGVAILLVATAAYTFWPQTSPNEVPLIAADHSPEKVKPVDEGGLDVPNQDIAILEGSQATTSEQTTETVMPEAEQPIAAAPEAPEAAPSDQTPVVSDPTTEPAAQTPPANTVEELAIAAPSVPEPQDQTTSSGNQVAAAVAPAEVAQPAVPEIPAPPVPPSQTDDPVAAVLNATADAAPTASSLQQGAATATGQAVSAETPQQPEQAAPAEANQVASVQPTLGGKFRVQLAAVKSESAAKDYWAKLQTKHGDLLGALDLTVEKVDKGTAGIFYRVQGGPLADRATAKTLCAGLKKRGQDCIVAQ